MNASTSARPGVAFAPRLASWNAMELVELRARAAAHGLDPLSARDVLALALDRRGRTDPLGLAQRLLARFGSLPEVLGAPVRELEAVAGRRVASQIRLLHELHARSLCESFRRRRVLASSTAVLDYLRVVMAAEPREQFRVLFLDRRNALIADEVLGWGTVDHAPVYPREVVRRALELSASALILSHNHPGRDPTPSTADVDMTRQVVDACRALGIAVHDHLVVGGDEVASLRARGLM